MWRVCIHAMKLGPLWGGLDSINTEVLGLGVWDGVGELVIAIDFSFDEREPYTVSIGLTSHIDTDAERSTPQPR